MRPNEQPAKCPDEDDYFRRWIERRRRRSGATAEKYNLVVVGVNKGYTISSLLSAIGITNASRETVARAALRHRRAATSGRPLTASELSSLCGACCDCGYGIDPLDKSPTLSDEVTNAPLDKTIEVNVHGFEPMASNFDFLAHFWGSWQSAASKHTVSIKLHRAAVSSASGTARFPHHDFGAEGGSLRSAGNDAPEVNVTTLDEALPQTIDEIAVLLVDAEGADYLVADGSKRHLLAGRVGLFVFELHGNDRRLGDFVAAMSKAGMECVFPLEHYFKPKERMKRGHLSRRFVLPPPGHPDRAPLSRSAVRISDECWRDVYNNATGWKNAICYNRKDLDWQAVFSELAAEPRVARECRVSERLRGSSEASSAAWAKFAAGKRSYYF